MTVDQSNTTFTGGDPTWANACVGENGFIGYREYAKGFSRAAIILIEMALQAKGLDLKYSVDELVYPVCFNMRHCVELCLKEAIADLIHIEDLRHRDLQFNLSGHDIKIIWDFFVQKAKDVDDRYVNIIERLDKKIEDIANVDATGQAFRYPLDTDSRKHLVDIQRINFVVLKNSFAELEAALDDLHHLNKYLYDEYAWGSFTKRLSRNNLFELASFLPPRSEWAEESFDATRKMIKERFKIGSKELSDSLKLIESHFELAPKIELTVPLLGVEEADIEKFFCHWFKYHDVPSDKNPINLKYSEWNSDSMIEACARYRVIEEEIWGTVKSNLTPMKLAGMLALYYFAVELDFSECYIKIYEQHIWKARLALSGSNDSIRHKYFEVFSSISVPCRILKYLYFLHKNELANRLVNSHSLNEKFSWLDDSRNRILYQKTDYCGYAR